MAAALAHPDYGYYLHRDPFGVAGDFTTAPEISQIFGELIGLWCYDAWERLGAPASFSLVELGPGRGTLMKDALRATARLPGFHEAASVILLETSPALRERQRQSLAEYHLPVRWASQVAELPEAGSLILIANEFFDALPIDQYVRSVEGIHRRMVTLAEDGSLQPQDSEPLSSDALPAGMAEALADALPGTIKEYSSASRLLFASLADRLRRQKGAFLLADYGYCHGETGDSLQALKAHRFVSPFHHVGEADITAHVDFQSLARLAEAAGLNRFGPLPQGEFLTRLGAPIRLQQLLRQAKNEQKAELMRGVERLLDPAQMGQLFKVMAIASKDIHELAGF
jgi:NADH dehydrogenase [ubiquinone] 1 alpha subcomplex assembly factor 7